MTFEQLRIFLTVVEHLHFTRAADALYITQPAVSAAVQNLESELSVKLFHRIGRHIEITEAGKLLQITEVEEPLGFLSHQLGMGWLGELIGIGALFSFFACVLGSINPAARIFFTMARHGLFPASMGKTHLANKTPHIAVTICSFLLFLIPACLCLFGVKLFASMGYLGAMCSYGFLTVYVLISLAAPIYLHKIKQLRLQDVIVSVLAIAFMAIPVLGSVGIPGSQMFPSPEAPYNLFPYLFLIYITLTSGWFIWQKTRFPGITRSMRRSMEEIEEQFATPETVPIPSLLVGQ